MGQLESPIKISQRSQNGEHIEDIRPSSDVNIEKALNIELIFQYINNVILTFQVVSHMQCLMGENSVDYMAKFANLASQIASDDKK